MPYLNWKDPTHSSGVRQEIAPAGASERHVMRLQLTRAGMTELLSVVSELAPGSELRIDLPDGWILFWKLREADSRLLVAHPRESEWVATAALEAGHAEAVRGRFTFLSSGGPGGGEVRLGELGSELGVLSSSCNLELVFALREDAA